MRLREELEEDLINRPKDDGVRTWVAKVEPVLGSLLVPGPVLDRRDAERALAAANAALYMPDVVRLSWLRTRHLVELGCIRRHPRRIKFTTAAGCQVYGPDSGADRTDSADFQVALAVRATICAEEPVVQIVVIQRHLGGRLARDEQLSY